MGIFSKEKSKAVIKASLAILVIVGIVFLLWTFREKITSSIFPSLLAMGKKKEEPVKEFGVVDYDKLIKEHPDYEKLKKYDEEISKLGPSQLDITSLEKLNKELREKLVKFHKDMEKELLAERDRIQAEAKGEEQKIISQYESIASAKRAEYEKYQNELKKEFDKAQKDPNRPLTNWEKEFTRRVAAQSRDLIELKERQIAAKRLELEKKSSEKLLSLKNKLESQIAQYEDSLNNENNVKVVNLRLKLQAAKDDEERQQLQDELNAIYKDIESKVAAKREELRKEFNELESSEKAANEKALALYRAKLENDVNRQLSGVREKVASQMAKEGRQPDAGSPMAIPEDIRKKLESKRTALESEMKVVQAKMRSEAAAVQSRAMAKFEEIKARFTKKLEDYQKQLAEEFENKKKQMIDQQMNANLEKKKSWEKLKEARERKYREMIADINKQVEGVAKEKNVKIVIGAYTVNINGMDLNDPAIGVVRKLKKN